MPTFAAVTDIPPLVGGRSISASTTPNTTQVTAWIDEAEAELLGTLASVAIPTDYPVNSRGYRIIRHWVTQYIAGLFRQSHAAAGGDGGNNDGKEIIDAWRKMLQQIVEDSPRFEAMLSAGGSAAKTNPGMPGSHVTDPVLGLTASDYGPTFELGKENF